MTGDGPGPDAELAAVMGGCRESHRRLLDTVAGLDDAAVAAPSRLDGWSRGHVLTHLARNADSYTRMLQAALAGEAVEQYPGGRSERAGAIEAGAGRPARELIDDVVRATDALGASWAAMTPGAWAGHGLSRRRPWPCRAMPYSRWREVEIHHVDLGAGYEIVDWPEEYVRRELAHAIGTVPDRLPDAVERRRVLAWLIGRAASPGDLHLDPWESRPAHYFRGISD